LRKFTIKNINNNKNFLFRDNKKGSKECKRQNFYRDREEIELNNKV